MIFFFLGGAFKHASRSFYLFCASSASLVFEFSAENKTGFEAELKLFVETGLLLYRC